MAPVPPILVLAISTYPFIAAFSPLLSATGTVMGACVNGMFFIVSMPFACLSSLNNLLTTTMLPIFNL